MTVNLLSTLSAGARPVRLITERSIATLGVSERAWANAHRWTAAAGSVLLVPNERGEIAAALLGLGAGTADRASTALLVGALGPALPHGEWALAVDERLDPQIAAFAFLAGAYRFERYRREANAANAAGLFVDGADVERAKETASAVALARDLINTPANDLGPVAIEAAVRRLAERFGASVETVEGDALLDRNFPLIHAVGRASAEAPRLVELRWGRDDAPPVTLVGKGVAFDTGGLDIKPAAGMLLMKKDMGGAANVLALAQLVMSRQLPVRLRVLVPAVENAISGNSFRPGDVLPSRKGLSVEIGNTDAEGRLILADALSYADEEAPRLLVDMATLTGAARVALGPDLPPFYTSDETLALRLSEASAALADPLWRMPLWQPYRAGLASKVADTNNVTTDGMAGSVVAALFLQRFVERAQSFVHLDIYGWRPKASPLGPVGGEAQGIRALERLIEEL